jgi:RNA polymerase sigma factor (sigma-70 family)
MLPELVTAATEGDARAWEMLVARFSGLVWAVARGYGLSEVDSADVSQTTWLRLAEHLDRIREPDRLSAWLAATARHEALRVIRRAERHVALDDKFDDDPCEEHGVDRRLLEDERDRALWAAFESLSPPCKTLLRVLVTEPPPTYQDVSAALGIPIGSIGPTRSRCLDRLRRRARPALDGTSIPTTLRSRP